MPDSSYLFGEFQLDCERFELRRKGIPLLPGTSTHRAPHPARLQLGDKQHVLTYLDECLSHHDPTILHIQNDAAFDSLHAAIVLKTNPHTRVVNPLAPVAPEQ